MVIEQQVAWSDVAEQRRDLMVRYLVPLWTGLLDATHAIPGKLLLDTGCGTGELVGIALDRGCIASGTDFASRMIAMCRDNPALREAKFFEASTEELPFEANTFDIATASMSIHFCRDVSKAIREVFRVVKPGGRVGIAAPASLSLEVLIVFHLAVEMVGPELRADIGRPMMFAQDGRLASSLESAGFGEVTEVVVDAPFSAGSFEELWELQKTWAPVRSAAEQVGEATFLAAYQQKLLERVGTATPNQLEMKYRIVTGIKPGA